MLQSYFLFTNLFFKRTVVRCGLLWQRANARKVSFVSVKIWPLPTCLIPNIIFILSWKVFTAWLLKRNRSFVEFLPLLSADCHVYCHYAATSWTVGKKLPKVSQINQSQDAMLTHVAGKKRGKIVLTHADAHSSDWSIRRDCFCPISEHLVNMMERNSLFVFNVEWQKFAVITWMCSL